MNYPNFYKDQVTIINNCECGLQPRSFKFAAESRSHIHYSLFLTGYRNAIFCKKFLPKWEGLFWIAGQNKSDGHQPDVDYPVIQYYVINWF